MLGLIISVVLSAMVVWTAWGAMRRGELELGERTVRRDEPLFWVVTVGGVVAGGAIAAVSLRAYWEVHQEDEAPPQQLVRDGVRITIPGSWRPLDALDEGMGASREVLAVGGDGAELLVMWPPAETAPVAPAADLREFAEELKSPALSYERWDVAPSGDSVVIDAVYPSPRGRVRLRHLVFSQGGRPRVVTATCSTEGEARLCDAVVASLERVEEAPAAGSAPSAAPAPSGAPLGLALGDEPCALRENGTVRCWGGPPPATLRLSDVRQLAGAGTRRCAVHGEDRALACWQGRSEPTASNDGAPPLREVSRIELAETFGCALHGPAGQLSCWGEAAPTPPAGLEAVDLGVGRAHACALTSHAEVVCFGAGSAALGPNALDRRGRFVLRGALALTASSNFTCALLATHQPWCWGDDFAADGDAASPEASATPLRIEGVDDVVELTAGPAGACARLTSGSVTCWGASFHPRRLLEVSEAQALAVGDHAVCVYGIFAGQEGLACWPDDGEPRVVPRALWAD